MDRWPDDLLSLLPAGCSPTDDIDTLWYAIARNAAPGATVLHMGAKRSDPDVSTVEQAKAWFPEDVVHVGTDIEAGEDVDVVADAHDLYLKFALQTEYTARDHFDFVVSRSVMEHLEEPWTVVKQMFELVKKGGWAFIQTHQTFPLHNHPSDYYRFSTAALESLFSPKRGWRTVRTGYYYPCRVLCATVPMHAEAEAFLNVNCLALRV